MSERARGPVAALDHLGDFSTSTRVLPIAALAAVIGVFAAYLAAGLLALIGYFTNLFFFQRPPQRLFPRRAITSVRAYGDEPLRMLAFRMADTGVTCIPVVERRDGALVENGCWAPDCGSVSSAVRVRRNCGLIDSVECLR
jgi:hypothetical protein